MCGICAELILTPNVYKNRIPPSRSPVYESLDKLSHRGPDNKGYWETNYYGMETVLGHTRLSIMNPESGAQPIVNKFTGVVLTVNGEIYNYEHLSRLYLVLSESLKSDCDVLTYMFNKHHLSEHPKDKDVIAGKLNSLVGMFAFVMVNESKPYEWLIARDPIGIIPLYIGYMNERPYSLFVASEMKALNFCDNIKEFEPGTYMTNYDDVPQIYYRNLNNTSVPSIINRLFFNTYDTKSHLLKYDTKSDGHIKLIYSQIYYCLKYAVKTHLQYDIKSGCNGVGVLLSGGLDSSIIAALTREIIGEDTKLHTFSIGLEGSPDLENARLMAEHIKSNHHEFIFTVEEALNSLEDVIYFTETYDTTTVRASTPMVLLARRIRDLCVTENIELKVVLSGEGADEIFGGYLYFSKAPNPEELQLELERKVSLLSYYDCLRANKSMMSAGIELRVPFLDTEFINYAMSIDPKYKMSNNRIEKELLRESFKHLLPDSIYKRQKEQFSDGVGYNWIDSIKSYTAAKISEMGQKEYIINKPQTNEQHWYRYLFEKHYPTEAQIRTVHWDTNSFACSTGKVMEWDASLKVADPSGRTLSHHNVSLNTNQ